MDEARSSEQKGQEEAQKRQQGQFAQGSGMAYSAEALRSLMNAERITSYRAPLQNLAGQFLYRPNDDGTTTTGTWGIDEWGRVVAL